MKFADINKVFTAEVNKYLERGYHFNTATMRGSQGEIAHIDLTDGAEVVRVLLRTFTEGWDKQGVELIAGRVLEKEHISPDAEENHADTIWNDRLEQISIQRYPAVLRSEWLRRLQKVLWHRSGCRGRQQGADAPLCTAA